MLHLEKSFFYQSLDDAVKLLAHGGYIDKVDLKSTYKSVSIHPDDHEFMGLV